MLDDSRVSTGHRKVDSRHHCPLAEGALLGDLLSAKTSRSKLSSVQLSPRLATEGRAVKVCFIGGECGRVSDDTPSPSMVRKRERKDTLKGETSIPIPLGQLFV